MDKKQRIVLASGNAHKIKEISDMLPEFEVVGYKDLGFDFEIEEDGKTIYGDLGYFINPEYGSKGYAIEAVRGLTHHFFKKSTYTGSSSWQRFISRALPLFFASMMISSRYFSGIRSKPHFSTTPARS